MVIARKVEPHPEAVLMSVTDAAKALGVGRSTAYILMGEGKLVAVKIGSRRLVKVDSIHAYVDALSEAA